MVTTSLEANEGHAKDFLDRVSNAAGCGCLRIFPHGAAVEQDGHEGGYRSSNNAGRPVAGKDCPETRAPSKYPRRTDPLQGGHPVSRPRNGPCLRERAAKCRSASPRFESRSEKHTSKVGEGAGIAEGRSGAGRAIDGGGSQCQWKQEGRARRQ